MQPDRLTGYSIATLAIATLVIWTVAAGIGALSATLGAPLGAIMLGEVSGFACLVAFTLLICGAIQDGKQPDRETIPSLTSG